MSIHQPVPCPPPWWQPASQCFDQVKQFEEMLQAMVDKTVHEKLKQLYEQGALPPGVVDGSDARPGQVGEFIRGIAQVNYAAHPTKTTATISPLVVPAGDWDLFGITELTAAVGFASVAIKPVPAGVSDLLWASEGSGTLSWGQLTFNTVRGNFTVPTLLPFEVIIDQSTDPVLLAGTANVAISGRRRR